MAACAAARMFAYNATLCACNPGYYYYLSGNGTASCAPMPGGGWGDWQVGSVGAPRNHSLYFLEPVLSIDAIRRLTQSQAVFLEVTLASLLCWLAFCAAARFGGRDPRGEKRLFRARYWVSRLDCLFDNNHWTVRSLFLLFAVLISCRFCTNLTRNESMRLGIALYFE
jgi:hypothetical protein